MSGQYCEFIGGGELKAREGNRSLLRVILAPDWGWNCSVILSKDQKSFLLFAAFLPHPIAATPKTDTKPNLTWRDVAGLMQSVLVA
jgi:hypothetical protein